jgi:hypothetical protein
VLSRRAGASRVPGLTGPRPSLMRPSGEAKPRTSGYPCTRVTASSSSAAFETRVYTTTKGANAGQEVRKLEVLVDEIGPSLRWAEAQIQRVAGQRSEETVSEEAPM